MSIMVNGGNSSMTHSVRTFITTMKRRTTGNLTTTIPISLWYCYLLLFISLNKKKTLNKKKNGLFQHRYSDIRCNLLQAEARSEGSQEYYEDMMSMLKARKESGSSMGGVSVGVYYVEVGLTGSGESEFLKNITQHKSQVWSTDPQSNMFNMIKSAGHFIVCFEYISYSCFKSRFNSLYRSSFWKKCFCSFFKCVRRIIDITAMSVCLIGGQYLVNIALA